MIAMALAEPEVLIADEPTTALDVTMQAQILDADEAAQARVRLLVVLITHDIGVVSQLAERIIVMYAGSMVEEGPRSAVFHEPQHPYTCGLFNSFPTRPPASTAYRNPRFAAVLPAPPAGCRFEPRCAYRFELCATRPELAERVKPGRGGARHLDPAVCSALRRKTA